MTKDMTRIQTRGLGRYTLSNTEYCLIARKGQYWRESKKVRQIIQRPISKHSKKPNEIRNRIVELCGDVSRIELFARERFEGWDVWGDEITSNIKLQKIKGFNL